MKLQGPEFREVGPHVHGYDIVTVMEVIGIEDEESPPATIEVNGVNFTLVGRVTGDEGMDLYWSYWNDDDEPPVNLQLWFS